MSPTIGIDVGGTKIAGGVVDEDGTVLEESRVSSPAEDSEAVLTAISDMINDLGQRHRVEAAGISAAAFIDHARARVYFAPNLAWRDVELTARVAEATGLRVVAENDGNAAAWGEFTAGAAHDADDLLMIAVGTGVGGGLVVDGELYRGGYGIAGEIGHVRVEREGRECRCGLRGCLEQYASGSALEHSAQQAAHDDPASAARLLEHAAGEATAITGEMVTEAARAGDPFSIDQLATLGSWLGEGAAIISAVVDPGVIVVGGGVCAAGDLLLEPMRATYAQQLTGAGNRPVPELRTATLGNSAGLLGAAGLARR